MYINTDDICKKARNEQIGLEEDIFPACLGFLIKSSSKYVTNYKVCLQLFKEKIGCVVTKKTTALESRRCVPQVPDKLALKSKRNV